MHYDVTILGGGPAGNAAGLSLKRLRPSLKVLIVEASRNHQWQVGETLSPGCKSILQSLGCWDHFCAECFIESYGTTSAWGHDRASDNEFIFSLGGSGYHIDRLRFERLLSHCSQQAGAELLSGFHVASQEFVGNNSWHLTLRGTSNHRPSNIEHVETHFVIDATGRAASFAVQNGAHRSADDRLMGVFTRFTFPSGLAPKDPRTLIEAQPDGWWYSALTPDDCMVVAWMSDADLIRAHSLNFATKWLEHLQHSRLTSARVVQGQPELPPRLQAAQSQILTRTSGPGWVAAGDAATALDPLSSQGILKALRTGKLSSFVALDCLTGRPSTQSRYDALVVRDYEQYKGAKTWFYSQEQRWPHSLFWSRRY